jgi:hypothetical protein
MNVLHYGPNPPPGTLTLALFPRRLNPAKLDQCLTARFGCVQSSRYSGCDCLFEVKVDLFVEFTAVFCEKSGSEAASTIQRS